MTDVEISHIRRMVEHLVNPGKLGSSERLQELSRISGIGERTIYNFLSGSLVSVASIEQIKKGAMQMAASDCSLVNVTSPRAPDTVVFETFDDIFLKADVHELHVSVEQPTGIPFDDEAILESPQTTVVVKNFNVTHLKVDCVIDESQIEFFKDEDAYVETLSGQQSEYPDDFPCFRISVDIVVTVLNKSTQFRKQKFIYVEDLELLFEYLNVNKIRVV